MDPSLLQPLLHPSPEDVKPSPTITIPVDENGDQEGDSHDEDDGQDGTDSAKRPRLRLAHACDRCRKRKIRCDTQQPCGPCSASRNLCTFHTPSRRIVKPKSTVPDARSGGTKRPHSMTSAAGASGQSQSTLEARLATLEAMLREVPPNVHNAYLSTLDAQLGSGTGIGIQEGDTQDLNIASTSGFASWLPTNNGSNAFKNSGLDHTLSTGWSNGWTGGPGLKTREEKGVNEMARRMEGLSFFYEDEIGQAKWQGMLMLKSLLSVCPDPYLIATLGATSGFPLLDLLTAANAPTSEPEAGEPSPVSQEDSTISSLDVRSPGDDAKNRRASSQSAIPTKGRSASYRSSSRPTSPNRKKERFFPDRTPRPSQTLNPEASWKVITGVIPPDLMDTLVRCYLSTSHLLWPFLHVPSFLADYANPAQWGEPGFACFIVAVCTLSSRHVDDPRVRANPSDPSTAGKQYFELFKRLRDLPSADRPTLYSIQAAFLAAIFAFGLGNLSKAFALQAESVTLCLDGGLHRSVDGYDHFDLVEKETRKRTFWSIYSWDKQSAALFGRPPIIHLRDCDVTEPMIIDDESLTPDGVSEQSDPTTSRICAFVAAIRLHVILEGVIDSSVQPSNFPTSPFLAQAAATIAKRSPQSEGLRDEEALLEEWERILPKYWKYDKETTDSKDPIRITQAERLHCLEHLVKMIIYRHRFSGFVAMPASTVEERGRHLDLCRKAMQCALTIIADHVHISQRGMMTYYGVHVIHQLAQAGRTLVAVILNCKNIEFRPLISPSVEGLRSCVGLLRRFSGRYLCGLRSADIIDEFCRICNIPVDSPRVPDGSGRPSPAWLRPVRRRASPSPGPGTWNAPEQPASSTYNDSIMPTDLETLFNTSAYFDTAAIAEPSSSKSINSFLPSTTLGQASAPFDMFETITPSMGVESAVDGVGSGNGNGMDFNYNANVATGSGVEEEGGQGQGLSAATILSLLEEGSFDYGSIFTDQAPLPDFEMEGEGV